MTLVFVLLLIAYAAASATRIVASWRFLDTPPPMPGDARDVTVLVPILSGDPALSACLRANVEANAAARFMLLVDEDDAAARRIAGGLANETVTVLVGPPPQAGENPKVAKLARALPLVETPLFAVCDDDTAPPPGALARAAGALMDGDLVTGLPLYVAEGNFWTRLLAAFVNGAALATYPCAAHFGAQRTINGMFYLGETAELRALGGFDAIRAALTDDYAMAKLYLRAGKSIAQSTVVHPIRTTVRDGAHYRAIMRRWMIFAMRYVRENRSPFTLGLIGLPTLLPPLLLVLSLLIGVWAFVLVALALGAKAVALAWMRQRFAQTPTLLGDMALEVLADLMSPAHLVAALMKPNAFQWRSRAMRMHGEHIDYD